MAPKTRTRKVVVSGRTDDIEAAVKAVTDNLLEYPSTPYTAEQAETLGKLLNALETSKRIDQMGGDE
jgi:hypothetical protein